METIVEPSKAKQTFSVKRPVRPRVADGIHFSTITGPFRGNEAEWE